MTYDIFISYRRDGGFETASLIAEKLRNAGYKVFLDVESLRAGKFNEQLFSIIAQCKDFILVLPKDGLERCVNETDWVRQEVIFAMQHNKNIIPIMLSGFQWGETLPEGLEGLDKFQAITAGDHNYFDAAIDRLKSYLKSKKGFTWQKYKTYILSAVLLFSLVMSIFLWNNHKENQYFTNVCINQTKLMCSGMAQINLNLNIANMAYKEWGKFRKRQINDKGQNQEIIIQEFIEWIENTKKSIVFPNNEQYKLSEADDILLKKHKIHTEEIKGFYYQVLPKDTEDILFYLNSLQENAKEPFIMNSKDELAEAYYKSLEYSATAIYYSILGQLSAMPNKVYDEFEKWLPKLNNFTGISYKITFAESEAQANAFIEKANNAIIEVKSSVNKSEEDIEKIEQQINQMREIMDGNNQNKKDDAISKEIDTRLQNIQNLSAEIIEMQQQLQETEIKIEKSMRNTIEKCKLLPEDDQYLMWGKIVKIATSMARTETRRTEAERNNRKRKEELQAKGYDVSNYFEVKYTLPTDEILREITTRLDQYVQYFPETKNYIPAVKQFYTDVKNGKQPLCGMVVIGTKDDVPHPVFKIGDIVLSRKGKTVSSTTDYQSVAKTEGDDTVTFLRLNSGKLKKQTEIVPKTDVLVGFLVLKEE